MRWADLDLNPNRRTLRTFALLLLLFAAIAFFRSHALPIRVVAALAMVVAVAGIVFPPAVREIYRALTVITFPIGWVVSRVILFLVFYAVVTPIGLLLRLFGRDPLRLRKREGAETYWQPSAARSSAESYLRQF